LPEFSGPGQEQPAGADHLIAAARSASGVDAVNPVRFICPIFQSILQHCERQIVAVAISYCIPIEDWRILPVVSP
jgi:hypothetical protein